MRPLDDPNTSTGTGTSTGAPAISSVRRPMLLMISGKRTVGQIFPIATQPLVIGRAHEVQVWVDDDGVSRRHAEVVQRGEVICLKDLGSKNGTFCNGEKVTEAVLKDGDRIQVGSTTILKLAYLDVLDEGLQRNLYEAATRDPLTGLANKRLFAETLAREFARTSRAGPPLSLLMLDLDHFKRVNDNHGHLVGDTVLRHVAELLRRPLAASDTLARYGGEEFAILLRDCPAPKAWALSEQVRTTVGSEAIQAGGLSLSLTVSIGVSTMPDARATSPDDFLREADDRLLAAKNAGRNRVIAEGSTPR